MESHWPFIGDFYCKKGIFVCGSRGRRDDEEIEIEVCHLFDPPASDEQIRQIENCAGRTLPPSYHIFFKETNGALLFTQKDKKGGYDCGCLIYPVELLLENQEDAKQWPQDCIDDDMQIEEQEQYQKWIDSLLIIGEEVGSGNYLAIDFSRTSYEPEFPIIFIDHETPLVGADLEDDDPVLAVRMDELLYIAAQDPAAFLMRKLGAITCYLDEANPGQWYPKKYRACE